MSRQKRVTQPPTVEQVQMAISLILQAEAVLPGLISLSAADKRALRSMGGHYEFFARRSVDVMQQHPGIVPPGVASTETQAELASADHLRPLSQLLARFGDRVDDTRHALGAQVLKSALDVYAQLKRSGQDFGLRQMHDELSGSFARNPRRGNKAAPARPAETAKEGEGG
jgi:hypothetical protein